MATFKISLFLIAVLFGSVLTQLKVCTPPCLTCADNDSTDCKTCVNRYPGYWVDYSPQTFKGSCKDCMPGCAKCTIQTSCTECGPKYRLDLIDNRCKDCMLGCLNCNAGVSTCSQCDSAAGFTLVTTTDTKTGITTTSCTNGSLAAAGAGILLILVLIIVAICVLSCAAWICCIYCCAKAVMQESSNSYEVQPATVVVYEENY